MSVLIRILLLALLGGAVAATGTQAQSPPAAAAPAADNEDAQEEADRATAEAILGRLNFKGGTITLGDGLATVTTGEMFRYLDTADTETFLTELWGNPPGAGRRTLGMLVPANPHPLSHGGWAAVITFQDHGYVPDTDAEKTDFDALLRDMQDDVRERNKLRASQGYEPVELVGWARAPFYDKDGKKLYWAKRLRFGDSETLNYVINILGRRGVLALTVVSAMDALPDVDRKSQAILDTVSFTPGNTYADYVPSMDKVAELSIAGLIAGGVLAKTGLLKSLFLFLLAFKKAALVGGIALLAGAWAVAKRFLRR